MPWFKWTQKLKLALKLDLTRPQTRLELGLNLDSNSNLTRTRFGTRVKKKTSRVELVTQIRLGTRESNSKSFHPY